MEKLAQKGTANVPKAPANGGDFLTHFSRRPVCSSHLQFRGRKTPTTHRNRQPGSRRQVSLKLGKYLETWISQVCPLISQENLVAKENTGDTMLSEEKVELQRLGPLLPPIQSEKNGTLRQRHQETRLPCITPSFTGSPDEDSSSTLKMPTLFLVFHFERLMPNCCPQFNTKGNKMKNYFKVVLKNHMLL
ncbi:Adhesion G-Protein Coupled Receptor D2 [Manis pentadactyla]|nr:Adhesion G-Protein Coupled Receptor D2 [Manis pentadactyla]